jgi:hypothetical protein
LWAGWCPFNDCKTNVLYLNYIIYLLKQQVIGSDKHIIERYNRLYDDRNDYTERKVIMQHKYYTIQISISLQGNSKLRCFRPRKILSLG